jgi:acetyl esterase/lipase
VDLEAFETNPEVNALHSPKEVLKKLPTTLVYTADEDPREDDGKKWRELLEEAEVPIQHVSMKVETNFQDVLTEQGCYSGFFHYARRVFKEQVEKIKEWKEDVEAGLEKK